MEALSKMYIKYEDAYETVYGEKLSIPPYIEEINNKSMLFIFDGSLSDKTLKQRGKYNVSH